MPNNADLRAALMRDTKVLLADVEELLKALGSESKESIASLMPRLEAAAARARTQLAETEAAVAARARQALREADTYAHENPWKTAGVAAGAGAALGAILGVLISRR